MGTPTFTEALRVEVAQLQAEHPLLKAALDRAFTLLVNGDLFPLDDGHTAHVRSQSDPGVSYVVNGSCDCLATQYRKEPCVHRYAFRLYHKAVERLTGDPEERWELAETAEAPPLAVPPALPEAPASITVRMTIAGHTDCLLTLRDTDDARLLVRMAAVLAQHPAPASPQGQPQSQPQSPVPACQYHGPMKASTKAPGTFFCTKKNFDGSYCRERFPHA